MTEGRGVRIDHYYVVEGRALIRSSLLCHALLTRVQMDDPHLSKEELIAQLSALCESLPKDPTEAF